MTNWLTHNDNFKKDLLDFTLHHGYADFDSKDLAIKFGELKKNWWGNGLVVVSIDKNDSGKWNVKFSGIGW